jgi:hypothetical protein
MAAIFAGFFELMMREKTAFLVPLQAVIGSRGPSMNKWPFMCVIGNAIADDDLDFLAEPGKRLKTEVSDPDERTMDYDLQKRHCHRRATVSRSRAGGSFKTSRGRRDEVGLALGWNQHPRRKPPQSVCLPNKANCTTIHE